MTIYIIYFITVAVLGTVIFRLFAERDFWQGEFLDSSAAHVAEIDELEARIRQLVTDYGNLMSDGVELKQHCDGIERLSEAQAKTISQLEADCSDLFNRNRGLHGAVMDLRAVVQPIRRYIDSLEE